VTRLLLAVAAVAGLVSVSFVSTNTLPWNPRGYELATFWYVAVLTIALLGDEPWRDHVIRILSVVALPAIIVVFVQQVGLIGGSWRILPSVLIAGTSLLARRPAGKLEMPLVTRGGAAVAGLDRVRYEWWRSRHIANVQELGGNGTEKVQITILTAFNCPSCNYMYKQVNPLVRALVATNPTEVAVNRFDIPDDRACNPRSTQTGLACEATVVARLAKSAGKGPEAEAMLHGSGKLDPGSLAKVVSSLGLETAYEQQREAELDKLRTDVASRPSARVPTYLVNGISVGLLDHVDIEKLIRRELAR
jgi:hypothetical protein